MATEASAEEHAQSLAKTLVMFARLVGQREDKVTPFEEEASKNGYDFKGIFRTGNRWSNRAKDIRQVESSTM